MVTLNILAQLNKQTGKENKKQERTYIDKKFISKSTSIPINEIDNLFKYFQDTIIERERFKLEFSRE